jgi:hypothetical protein
LFLLPPFPTASVTIWWELLWYLHPDRPIW